MKFLVGVQQLRDSTLDGVRWHGSSSSGEVTRCSAHHAPSAWLASRTRSIFWCLWPMKSERPRMHANQDQASRYFAASRGQLLYSKIRIAAAITVVHKPPFSPISVCAI